MKNSKIIEKLSQAKELIDFYSQMIDDHHAFEKIQEGLCILDEIIQSLKEGGEEDA